MLTGQSCFSFDFSATMAQEKKLAQYIELNEQKDGATNSTNDTSHGIFVICVLSVCYPF